MSQLSAAAIEYRRRVEDEALFLETCEGGDPGTPEQPSIWVLGIEPGWSIADAIADKKADPVREANVAKYAIEQQLTWPYNCKAFQLLAEMNGEKLEDYVEFAQRVRPFEQGCKGYFKANLFPEPFNNVHEWPPKPPKRQALKTRMTIARGYAQLASTSCRNGSKSAARKWLSAPA